MSQFQYKAMNQEGKMSNGSMDAVNPADLELRLARIGLDLIRSKEIKKQGRVNQRGITRKDVIGFCFYLEQLTRAGVPILEGLGDLRDTLEHPAMRQLTASMIEAIEGGESLSNAMASFPNVFDEVTTSLVRAGEETGELSEVFARLTESLKWQDEQITQVKKLLTYPAVIATVVIGVIMFIMVYLVPKLISFIAIMGEELPMHTRILVGVSDFLTLYWYIVIAVPILIVLFLRYLISNNESAHFMFDDIKLRVWIIGPLIKKVILARFANYFALMYASGITILDSMRISETIVGNRALALAMQRAAQHIADGATIHASFESAGLFPPLVMRMLRVGETTGQLDKALLNIGDFYTREVKETVERLQTMIEPAMTLFLATILGWVMFSVLGPIYDLIANIKI
jgi:type IV pilus assembly protein PilC